MWYAYATRRKSPALRGVDLKLEPGKLLALVGLSGSGKSTLVALLERLYDPTEGQVCPFYYWHDTFSYTQDCYNSKRMRVCCVFHRYQLQAYA